MIQISSSRIVDINTYQININIYFFLYNLKWNWKMFTYSAINLLILPDKVAFSPPSILEPKHPVEYA